MGRWKTKIQLLFAIVFAKCLCRRSSSSSKNDKMVLEIALFAAQHMCVSQLSRMREEKRMHVKQFIRTLNDRHTRTESHDATAVNQLIAYPIPDIGARAFCIRSMCCLCAMASHVCAHDIVYYCHTISKRTLCGRCWVHHDKTNILHSRFRFDLFGLHWFDSVCLFCLLYSLLFNQLLDLRHSKVSKFKIVLY